MKRFKIMAEIVEKLRALHCTSGAFALEGGGEKEPREMRIEIYSPSHRLGLEVFVALSGDDKS
jgi:hypothetical protein